LEDGSATIQMLFSPNTDKAIASPPREDPADVNLLFDLIKGAKQAVLFLAFEPGNNSILDAAGEALHAKPSLFVRGALTSASNAMNFKAALDGSDDTAPEGRGRRPRVATIGENPRRAQPDFRHSGNAGEQGRCLRAWEASQQGFAIHDKIPVIDPFSMTHRGDRANLGYRARNNDENMVIVRGHRSLAGPAPATLDV
jgi:hypothetical protein